MKKNQRPNKGDTLTLDYHYWHGEAVPGTKVEVVEVRVDQNFVSRLRILVKMPNVMHPVHLDARRFKEFTPDFVYTPKKSRKTVAQAPALVLANLMLTNAKEADDVLRQVQTVLMAHGIKYEKLCLRLTALIHWNGVAIKAATGKTS